MKSIITEQKQTSFTPKQLFLLTVPRRLFCCSYSSFVRLLFVPRFIFLDALGILCIVIVAFFFLEHLYYLFKFRSSMVGRQGVRIFSVNR